MKMSKYLPLAEAAERAKCTEKHLVHLGSIGELAIHVIPNPDWLLGNQTVLSRSVDVPPDAPPVTDYYCSSGEMTGPSVTLALLRVLPHYLTAFEAYPDTATVDTFIYWDDGSGVRGIFTNQGAKPILLRDCYLVIRTDDLKALGPTKSVADEPASGGVSRTTLLKLLITMAVDGYRYDPADKKGPVPREIDEASTGLGIRVSDDTIRGALREAATYLPQKQT